MGAFYQRSAPKSLVSTCSRSEDEHFNPHGLFFGAAPKPFATPIGFTPNTKGLEEANSTSVDGVWAFVETCVVPRGHTFGYDEKGLKFYGLMKQMESSITRTIVEF